MNCLHDRREGKLVMTIKKCVEFANSVAKGKMKMGKNGRRSIAWRNIGTEMAEPFGSENVNGTKTRNSARRKRNITTTRRVFDRIRAANTKA